MTVTVRETEADSDRERQRERERERELTIKVFPVCVFEEIKFFSQIFNFSRFFAKKSPPMKKKNHLRAETKTRKKKLFGGRESFEIFRILTTPTTDNYPVAHLNFYG